MTTKAKTAAGRMFLGDNDVNDASMFEPLAKSMGLDVPEAPAEEEEAGDELVKSEEAAEEIAAVLADEELLKSDDYTIASGPVGPVVIDRAADRRYAKAIEDGVPTSHIPRGLGTSW